MVRERQCESRRLRPRPLSRSPDWSAARALIYSSRNSGYLVSVRENAAGMLDNIDVVHRVITSSNECVDVITEREPTVDIL